MVTIIDGEGGAGVFEFMAATVSIQEDGSPLAQGIINRTIGSAGVVTVQLSIVEERADGSQPANQIARASDGDYSAGSLATLVTFQDGELQKLVTVHVLNDDTPELEEYFTIVLSNPQSGNAIINGLKVRCDEK